MPTWTLETGNIAPHLRAEKMTVYLALLDQHWTWKLEVFKHLVILNGLGLAATATVSGHPVLSGRLSIVGAWMMSFVIGLSMGLFGMIKGMQELRAQRNAQIAALREASDSHPEMAILKEVGGLNMFIYISLMSFTFGVAAMVYVFN